MRDFRSTILIVTPDAGEQRRLVKCLGTRNRVIWVARLEEAKEQMAQQQPDILLLEPDLPGEDGLDWVRQLRQNPATRTMIIVCVTHRSAVRDKVAGFRAGVDDYIVQPVDLETFPYRLVLLTRIARLKQPGS
jgi:DNA-binding response OmpR family regulator